MSIGRWGVGFCFMMVQGASLSCYGGCVDGYELNGLYYETSDECLIVGCIGGLESHTE